MPDSSLSTILISASDLCQDLSDYMPHLPYDYMINVSTRSIARKTKIENVAFVHLNMSNHEQYFMLIHAKSPEQIFKEEYLALSIGRSIIDIECKSLSLLKTKTGVFNSELELQDGQIKNGLKSNILISDERFEAMNKLVSQQNDFASPDDTYFKEGTESRKLMAETFASLRVDHDRNKKELISLNLT